jgi:hypothetical protein
LARTVQTLKVTVVNRFRTAGLCAIVLAWHALDYYREWREREIQAAALEAQLAQAITSAQVSCNRISCSIR